ncbi:MAG TPA: histidine phosphatase family protein [Synergistaceae bacterium]|nr:histidine phosphatase family protein [Synergistaceae bacterium]
MYFARHGETEWNALRRYQGRSDVPLNFRGRSQASLLGERIRSLEPKAIFYSPLVRARETARIVGSLWGKYDLCEPLEELQEWNFGLWEGLTVEQIESSYGSLYSRWRKNPGKETPPEGESLEALKRRVAKGLSRIEQYGFSRVLVVTHGGVVRAALMILLGLEDSSFWDLTMRNCALTGVEKRNGKVMLSFYDDDSHLSPEKQGK